MTAPKAFQKALENISVRTPAPSVQLDGSATASKYPITCPPTSEQDITKWLRILRKNGMSDMADCYLDEIYHLRLEEMPAKHSAALFATKEAERQKYIEEVAACGDSVKSLDGSESTWKPKNPPDEP